MYVSLATTTHRAPGTPRSLDLLTVMSGVQELQVVSGVCSMLEAVRNTDRRGRL